MMQTSEAWAPEVEPQPGALYRDKKPPSCCHREMQALLRRAVLHSDGSVDYQIVWGCGCCGRRIL